MFTSVNLSVSKNITAHAIIIRCNKKGISNKLVPIILGIIALFSILTTVGIIVTLLTETITFFTRVPITDFLFTKDWNPFSSNPEYGI